MILLEGKYQRAHDLIARKDSVPLCEAGKQERSRLMIVELLLPSDALEPRRTAPP
jgi:hypothetical protein